MNEDHEIPEAVSRDEIEFASSPQELGGLLQRQVHRNGLRMRAVGIMPHPMMRIDIQIEALLDQLFPEASDRIKFEITCELVMEQRLSEAAEQAEMARAEAKTQAIRSKLTEGVQGVDLSMLKEGGVG